MPQIVLIGAGGHARACIDVIEYQKKYRIVGLIGQLQEVKSVHLNYEVIGVDDDMERIVQTSSHALITIGQIKTASLRENLYEKARYVGFEMPVIISPRAYVSRHARIGAGSIVMHGVTIGPNVDIGENCIVNSGAIIEHDSKIEGHCHISTGAILNGGVSVGGGSFVGSGCVIKEGVSIGKACVVGAGLTLRRALEDNVFFTGDSK